MTSRRAVLAGGLAAFALPAVPRAADSNDWPLASPASQGFDAAALKALLDPARILDVSTALYTVRSVVVIRNGTLVDERYYAGARPATLHHIASVTKSVTSMLVGVALEQGKIRSLDQTVGELLPEAAAKMPASPVLGVTLAQLLTQTGGFPDDRKVDTRDRDPRLRDMPLEPADPPLWRYSSAAVALLGPILARAVGGSLEDFARTTLLSPLGIESYDYDWRRDANGTVRTDSGLRLRARDLAKITWTMADSGRWRSRQIMPAHWVADSTRRHVAMGWTLPPLANIDYGYLWYTGTMHGRPVNLAWGYGAQFALIVPSLNLAVVTQTDAAQELAKQTADVMSLIGRIVELAS